MAQFSLPCWRRRGTFLDFHEFAQALTSVHWPWVALVMGLSTVDRFLMAGKWLQLLRYVRSTATFGAVLGAYYQVAFLERFIPSSLSGDALRAVLISRRFHGTNGVLATMVVEKLVAMVAAIVLALFGLGLLLTQRYGLEQWWLFALVPSLLLAAIAGLAISLHRPLASWLIRLLPARVRPVLTGIYAHYSSFREAPRILSWHFLFCIVEQVVQVLMWLGAALAIGVETPVIMLFAALVSRTVRPQVRHAPRRLAARRVLSGGDCLAVRCTPDAGVHVLHPRPRMRGHRLAARRAAVQLVRNPPGGDPLRSTDVHWGPRCRPLPGTNIRAATASSLCAGAWSGPLTG
jgi:uncharacterized membrane protein YbhN (UPF0104 family)